MKGKNTGTTMSQPTVVQAAALPWETWPDADIAARSQVIWKDLISGDRTPSQALSLGLGQVAPGHRLARHHHASPEVYYIFEGTGEIEIDNQVWAVGAGAAVFIPGHAVHQLHNTGSAPLHFVYVFPVDSVQELVYHFVPDRAE